MRNRLVFIGIVLALVMLGSCTKDPLARIAVVDNPWFKVASRPTLLATNLNNPMSPRLIGGKLILAESGAGKIITVENGKSTPLITGFVTDNYENYTISAQGITIDPSSGLWIITAAEGPGRVLLFNPRTFPTDAKSGHEIPIEGATDDNPFAAVLAAGGRILVVSGGTKTAYQGDFDPTRNPGSLKPVVEVTTGLIGLSVDPKSGDVFAAVFGRGPGTGEIVRWDASKQPVVLRKVASGLTNPVDVTFTAAGMLLSLEIGEIGSNVGGRVSIVATDGSGLVTPFITGLNNPTGFYLSSDNSLFITEFGGDPTGGTLISLKLIPGASY